MFFEVKWRAIAERTVAAARVIEGFDVVEGHELRGGAGGWDGMALPKHSVLRVATKLSASALS